MNQVVSLIPDYYARMREANNDAQIGVAFMENAAKIRMNAAHVFAWCAHEIERGEASGDLPCSEVKAAEESIVKVMRQMHNRLDFF